MKIIVTKYAQYITVESSPNTSINFVRLTSSLFDFNKRLVTMKLTSDKRRIKKVVDKYFYLVESIEDNGCNIRRIRYPITIANQLINYIDDKFGLDNEVIIKTEEPIEGKDIDINLKAGFKPRDYQKEAIKTIVESKNNNILIDLQTGYGKTFIALSAITKIKKRFGVVILPRYIDKWVSDITSLTDIKKDEILIINSSKHVIGIIENSLDIESYKGVIISLTTISRFINDWLDGKYCDIITSPPEIFFVNLDLGVIINDETHQEFHNVYKLMLYSNVKLLIALTATLISKDNRLNSIYYILFPKDNRVSNLVNYTPYINAYSVIYEFRNPKYLSYRSSMGYSQVKFEKSILKNSDIKYNYLELITGLIFSYYIKKMKNTDDKCLVFVGTISMAKELVNYLDKVFKDNKQDLVVKKYTEEDPYENIMEANVTVSTVLSAGTALDIPNLITVIQTVNMDSLQANRQAMGRLRRLKDRELSLVCVWSRDIPQHRKYHYTRLKLVEPIAKSIKTVMYRKPL